MRELSLSGVLAGLVRRDLQVAIRSRAALANPLLFFLMVGTLFPLGIGPEAARLGPLAPGILWVVALLATLLASESIFRTDYDDGSLEQMLLSPVSLYLLALAKTFAHWLISGLPLALMSPLLAMMLQLPAAAMPALALSLLLGTAVLSQIGAIGAALTVGLRRGGLLLSLIVLPLYMPVLIFGASAVKAAAEGLPFSGQLAVLGAMLALAVPLAPLAVAAALRLSVDQ
ncbi:MAG: heme exporter protein CcmB [Spongiibacteraceae bacterium]|jgi:heme exporter protein B|nr:heme exporter protein CcmB [Spongiibacteraceae bacterium]